MDFLWGVLTGLVLGFFIFAEVIFDDGVSTTMKEAYEQGYAVQCVGVEGYHWSCSSE